MTEATALLEGGELEDPVRCAGCRSPYGERPVFTMTVARRPPSQNDFTARWRSERLGYRAIKRSCV
ncbi:MAG: hypothetical protein O7F16_01445 [Acidobacteria bacterium]|nr:hypothetical protein [Acidobacteriota bacterium]